MIVRSFVERIRAGLRCAGLRKTDARKNRIHHQTAAANAEQLETRQLLTINFNFTYPGPIAQGGGGFEDNTLGLARRTALQNAADEFGAQFENTAIIDVAVTSSDEPNSGLLASAGSNTFTSGNSPALGGIEVVRTKVLTGIDLNGTASDGNLDVNWTTANLFELSGVPADVAATEFDFHSLITHELMHVIGFAASPDQQGSDINGVVAGAAGNWFEFDRFLTNSAGVPVIDPAGTLNQGPWLTLSVGGSSTTGNGLFFNGPVTVAANNGQPAGLFTPTVYSAASSVSHLDDTDPAFANMIMQSTIQAGSAIRGLSPVEEGVLIDLGYTLTDNILVTETNNDTVVSDLGNADTLNITLGRQPLSNVTLAMNIDDATEATLPVTTLTFTPSNWDVPQTLDVNGVADLIPDGDQTAMLTISVVDAASDPTFAAVQDIVVTITAIDDDGLLPELPVVLAPTGGAVSYSPLFSWTAGANSATYSLTVTNLITGAVTRQAIGLTTNSHTFPGTIVDGVYQTTVEAFNIIGQSSGLSDPVTFAVGVPNLPVSPTITAPTQGEALNTSTPQFSWTPVPEAFRYELEVITGGLTLTHSLSVDLSSAGNLTHTFAEIFSEGPGSVRVRAFNALDQPGEWSVPVAFVVDAVAQPAAPTIIRPTANVTANAFPEFQWIGPGAASYELWVGRVPDANGSGSSSSVNNRVIRLRDYTTTSYTHFRALPNGRYDAWVRSINSAGEPSAWSRSVRFGVDVPVPARPAVISYIENQGTNPTIGWATTGTDFTPRTTFHLWVNNLSTGQARVVQEKTLTTASYSFTDGLPQGRYGVWVQATSAVGAISAWSKRFDFAIDIAAPGRPTLTGPVPLDGDTVVKTDFPVFGWDAVPNGASYDLWVNSVSGKVSQIIRVTDIPAGTSYTHDEALPEGTYKAWLRSFNLAGEVGKWSRPIEFSLDVPGPAKPTITGPLPGSGGAVETSTPVITWTSLGGAATYNLQFEVVRTGESLANVKGLTQRQFSVTDMLSEQSYRVRVQGVNSVGEAGSWSDFYTFTVDVPNATTPVAYLPEGTVTRPQVTFQWQHTTSSVRYEILVRDLLRDESIVFQISTSQVDQTLGRALHTATLRDGTYRYWVRAFNTQGTASGWSNSKSFTVETVTSLTNEPKLDLEIAVASLSSVRQSSGSSAKAEQATQGSPTQAAEAETTEETGSRSESESSSHPADVEAVMAEFADPTNESFSQKT
jgi:hypothetical protein